MLQKRNEKQLWWQMYWPKEPYMKKLKKKKEFHMHLKLVIKLEHPIHENHFKEIMIVDEQLKFLK